MLNAGTVQSFATLNTRGFETGIRNVKKIGEKAAKDVQRSFKNIDFGQLGRNLTMRVTAPILGAGGALVKMASDAEETSAKFNTVFRDISKQANKSAKVLTDSFGLSQKAAQQLLGDTGDLLTGFGFTQDSALDLSEQVNTLAVDLASFTNFSGGAEGASQALTKALLGERESVKSLGISILETDVKAKVLENTKKGLTFETERQAKAYATLQLAQEQSKNAIGDFSRTQDAFANQTRELKGELSDLAVSFGKDLLPAAKSAVSGLRGAVSIFSETTAETKQLVIGLSGIAAAAGPTIWSISKLTTAFKTLKVVMMANPYVAIATAITAIGVAAFTTHQRIKAFHDEIERVLSADTNLDEVNQKIADVAERMRDVSDAAKGMGVNPEVGKEFQKLKKRLAELVQLRDELALKQIDSVISDKAVSRIVEGAQFLSNFVNTDFSKISEGTTEVDGLAQSIERVRVAVSQPTNEIIDPAEEARIKAMREEFALFNNALYNASIHTGDFSHRFTEAGENAKTKAGEVSNSMMALANVTGNAFDRAVLSGQKLSGVLKDLVKQLASRAFVTGLGALLTGGASLGTAGFFGTMFGGMFHSGGIVGGSGDKMIRAQGGEMVLTKSQQKALSMGNQRQQQPNFTGFDVHNKLYIDGRQIEIALEDTSYKRRR